MIFAASQENLADLWQHAKPHIDRFSAETLLMSTEDVYRDIESGDKQLWMVAKDGTVMAVAVTHVNPTQRGLICCVWAACGSPGIERARAALDEIEAWAKSIDCVAMEIRGRKGWKRVLPEFEETGILLEKSLRKVH